MRKGFIIFSKFFFLFLFSLYFFSSKAYAQQQPFDITASPNSFDLTVQPGSRTNEKIRIRNNSEQPASLSVTLKKLIPDRNGLVNLTDFASVDASKSWVIFPSSSLVALPREWTEIPLTLTIPKEAAFGYYYAVFISAKPNEEKAKTSEARITGSIAIPILLNVQKDGAIVNGKLLEFDTSQKFSEYLPVSFITLFENKGNTHIKPQGSIFIKDWTGQTVDTIDINKQQGAILPTAKRSFTSVWDNSFITIEPKPDSLPDSHGNIPTEIKFHFDKVLALRFGRYTAHALLIVSGQNKDIPYEATTTFWIFPWKIFGGIFVILIFAGLGIFNTVKTIMKLIKNVFPEKIEEKENQNE